MLTITHFSEILEFTLLNIFKWAGILVGQALKRLAIEILYENYTEIN